MSISPTWHEIEFPTTEDWVDFEHESGLRLRRPTFYDGGASRAAGGAGGAVGAGRKVRFAAPVAGRWRWAGGGESDEFEVRPAAAEETNPFYAHGFWRMADGGRSLVHADGTPAVLVADTAWALPWRATPEQVREYAADRQAKGFNAVLLMTVQPDMRAVGPRNRTAD
ncbi:DUF4038 domain-containing protein, partial [Kribbella sp.]|uniref:apiosidase-like domain-containing protein n=1 Tax=Kribbella sp. TaxID=1871183 RepID=UPI002D699F8D